MFWNGSAEVDVANGDFQHEYCYGCNISPWNVRLFV